MKSLKKYYNPSNYLQRISLIFVKLLSPFIAKFNKVNIIRHGRDDLKFQPIFIIGAPRTGSTILYQTITNSLDVTYIDNLTSFFYKNIFFGAWLSNKIFKNSSHNCYKSKYGVTRGLHSPSECGLFWYRWLPRNVHFVEPASVNSNVVVEIREELSSLINYFDKPLIINNNNAALRLRLLKQTFPDAKYIVCDRDPYHVATSLLEARKNVLGRVDKWWSLKPKNIDSLKSLDPVDQVVSQHYYVNKQMYNDLVNYIGRENYITIKYEDLLADNNSVLCRVSAFIGYNELRKSYKKPAVKNNKKSVSKFDADIVNSIRKRDWNDYKS